MINELRSLESSKQQRKMKVVLFLALAGICIANGKPMNWRNISRNFLQRKTLDVDFCKGLGYNYSSVMNFFMDEDSRSTAKNVIFRALSFLDRTSCSKLIKPLTCSIFAPSFVELFGAVPPCKSMCQEAERSCRPLLDFAAQFSPLSQPGSCKKSKMGSEFRGKINKTRGNLQCQRWDSQYPHKHFITPKTHPYENLEENYCRNPDGEAGGPWCYTNSKEKRWDFCEVPTCPGILFCDFLPTDGCIEWKFDQTKKAYERRVIGKPKKNMLRQWMSRMTLKDFSLKSFQDIIQNFMG